MKVREYTRNLSLQDDVTEEKCGEREGLSANPYVSPDAASLARDGYVQRRPDGTWYYAPDARALLSDAFVGTHCFHLQRDAVSGDSLIGIAFQPVRRRPPPDIRGVAVRGWALGGAARASLHLHAAPGRRGRA
jgi:hypothetical protein